MSAATQIYAHEFDEVFFGLSDRMQERIEKKIWAIGKDLQGYGHYRLQGRAEFRARVGDYRIIYEFDVGLNEVYLITLGHRSDVYE